MTGTATAMTPNAGNTAKHAFAPSVPFHRQDNAANVTLAVQGHNFSLWRAEVASAISVHDFYVSVGAGSQTAVLVHNCPGSYEENLPEAQNDYPNKAGQMEEHHIFPKYMGGDPAGETSSIDAAYHQEITNSFRALYPYGSGAATPEVANEIMNQVYSQWPLP